MSFNSLEFAFFFPVIFFLLRYTNGRARLTLLLLGNLLFLNVLGIKHSIFAVYVILISYVAGVLIEKAKGNRQVKIIFLASSISLVIAPLIYFKYYDFVYCVSGLASGDFSPISYVETYSMALPLGLSFYSLQAISYIVDVYYRKYSCEKNLLYFANFKSFFPQLVAGPIERVNTLLPQIKGDFRASNHDLNVGFFLMIWGFFKKIVIADNLAAVADPVFANPQAFSGHTLAIAVLAFTIQIYCDFSGYTDIATGAARMLGIKLSLNFNNPYFATSITNFWHRWHISLSTWFRDYVYTPIGGNRNGTKRMCIGLIIVFLLSGMWHGANFTFIAWSLIHLISIFVEKVVVSKRKDEQVRFTSWQQLLNWLVTLCIVMLGWIFFRAENIDDGFYIAKSIGLTLLGAVEEASYSGLAQPIMTNLTIGLIAAIFMFAVEYIVNHRIKRASSVLLLRRIGAFAIFGLVLLTLIAGNFGRSSFIYFQF